LELPGTAEACLNTEHK